MFLFQEDVRCTKNQKQNYCPWIQNERTLRNMRKVKSVESTNMENQRERLQPILEEEEAERPQKPMTMENFWRLVIQDEYFAVR